MEVGKLYRVRTELTKARVIFLGEPNKVGSLSMGVYYHFETVPKNDIVILLSEVTTKFPTTDFGNLTYLSKIEFLSANSKALSIRIEGSSLTCWKRFFERVVND